MSTDEQTMNEQQMNNERTMREMREVSEKVDSRMLTLPFRSESIDRNRVSSSASEISPFES